MRHWYNTTCYGIPSHLLHADFTQLCFTNKYKFHDLVDKKSCPMCTLQILCSISISSDYKFPLPEPGTPPSGLELTPWLSPISSSSITTATAPPPHSFSCSIRQTFISKSDVLSSDVLSHYVKHIKVIGLLKYYFLVKNCEFLE